MRFRVVPVFIFVLAVGTALLFAVPGRAADETDEPAVRAAQAQVGAAYREAFSAQDAEALGRCFTADAEFMNQLNEVHRGRDAIRSLASARFAADPETRVTPEFTRFRLIGDGVASLEGTATRNSADGKVLTRSRLLVVCVRGEDGWLIADLRESSLPVTTALTPRERLEAISWLVGDWVEETDEAMVRSSCRWSEDGPYLIQKFNVRDSEGRTSTSTQRIGWDPLLGKIRSWFWDATGGYGGAIWSETNEGWVLQSRGVSVDGTLRTGMHYVRREGEDAHWWEARNRIVGDTIVDDQVYFIVRQPPEPR